MINKAFEKSSDKKEPEAKDVISSENDDTLYADFFGLLSTQLSDITTSSLGIINLLKRELDVLQDCKLLAKLETVLDKNVSSLLKPMSIVHKLKPEMFPVDLIDVIEEFVQFLRDDQRIDFRLTVPESSLYISSNKMIHDLLNTVVDVVHSIFSREKLSVSCNVYPEEGITAKMDIEITGNYKLEIQDRMKKNLVVEEYLTTDIKILFTLLELLINAHGGSYSKDFGVNSLKLSVSWPIVEKD